MRVRYRFEYPESVTLLCPWTLKRPLFLALPAALRYGGAKEGGQSPLAGKVTSKVCGWRAGMQ